MSNNTNTTSNRTTGSRTGSLQLLRHGITQTSDIFRGQVDDPLADTGWEQMRGATLGGSWQRVVTSPLGRCREFALHLGIENGCDVAVDHRLQEYHFGDWDGKRYDDVMLHSEDAVRDFFDDPFNHTPPGGEKFTEFHRRVVKGYHDLLALARNDHVIVVTHGGVILSILAELLGIDRVHGRIDVPFASVTRIKPGLDGMPARLVSHGATI